LLPAWYAALCEGNPCFPNRRIVRRPKPLDRTRARAEWEISKHARIASLTVTGDAMCRATDKTYRLDTPSAQEFLSRFGLVPAP
jgi:hypothetical protein